MSVGDKIKTHREESQSLRMAIDRAQDEGEREQLLARRAQVNDEVDELVWETLTSAAPEVPKNLYVFLRLGEEE